MKIQHYKINRPSVTPPESTGWTQAWHGYYRLDESWTVQARASLATERNNAHRAGYLEEREFEVDCFLSVLANVNTQHVNLIEIGAGWGEWCLALAGIINYKLLPVVPTNYHCIAIEALPMHYKWMSRHFYMQNIHGNIIQGAVAKKKGKCYFNLNSTPSDSYGETMTFHSSNLIWGLYKFLTCQAIKVPCFTLDQLLSYPKQSCTIVHMDIQGAEVEVIKGSLDSIASGIIDYILIGTHRRKCRNSNNELESLLTPYYDLIVDAKPFSIYQHNNLTPVKCKDGMQVYKRRGEKKHEKRR